MQHVVHTRLDLCPGSGMHIDPHTMHTVLPLAAPRHLTHVTPAMASPGPVPHAVPCVVWFLEQAPCVAPEPAGESAMCHASPRASTA